jgi:hypothetical protein
LLLLLLLMILASSYQLSPQLLQIMKNSPNEKMLMLREADDPARGTYTAGDKAVRSKCSSSQQLQQL